MQPETMAARTNQPHDDVLADGPYVVSVVQGEVQAQRPAHHKETRPCKLPVFVSVPVTSVPSSSAPAGPFPVCVLLNGFQARASYYAPLARRLASWGVVVVQYNAPALTIIPDAAELPFLGGVVDWLKRAAASEAQPALQGRADLGRLLVAGHSRGGKLAALHYSRGSVAGVPIRGAFLIDPVDNTKFTAESADYPCAAKALKACGKPFGMAAAGLVSSSNPEGSNYRVFEAASAPGSWLMLLKRAGHTTFMKPPTGVETWLLDRVFGGGPLSRDAAVSQTAAAMLGWFGQQLSKPPPLQQQQQPALGDLGGRAGGTAHQQQRPGGVLDAVTAAAAAPLASSALAAAAVAAARPAPAVPYGQEEAAEPGAGPGVGLAGAFQAWVSRLPADEVEFRVRG